METRRDVIIDRTYSNGPDTHALLIVKLSGGNIYGEVFQYEYWLNGQKQHEKCVTSGNRYHVRDALVKKRQDLLEEGCSRGTGGCYGQHASFFDPGPL